MLELIDIDKGSISVSDKTLDSFCRALKYYLHNKTIYDALTIHYDLKLDPTDKPHEFICLVVDFAAQVVKSFRILIMESEFGESFFTSVYIYKNVQVPGLEQRPIVFCARSEEVNARLLAIASFIQGYAVCCVTQIRGD